MDRIRHQSGLYSIFNSDVVDDLVIYKGGTPARYGTRTASILNLSGFFGEDRGVLIGDTWWGNRAGSLRWAAHEAKAVIFNEGETDESPVPLCITPIPFPEAAKAKGLGGNLIIELVIGRTGATGARPPCGCQVVDRWTTADVGGPGGDGGLEPFLTFPSQVASDLPTDCAFLPERGKPRSYLMSHSPRSMLWAWAAAGALAGAVAGLPLLPSCVDFSTAEDAAGGPDAEGIDEAGLEGLKSIRIHPANAILYITNDQAISQVYKALGTFSDGKERDVTSATAFQLSNYWFGVFQDNIFLSSSIRGGTATVTASTSNGIKSTTALTVIFKKTFFTTGVAAGTDKAFSSAKTDKSYAPMLAYPPDNVLIPPNLNEMEIQWTPASGTTLFEVAFKNDGLDIRIYTKCTKAGDGCGLVPDATAWKCILLALKGMNAAKITVSGADSSIGSVGESAAVNIKVAQEDIKGGLYYWNATPGTIVRYDFGKTGQKAKNFYTAADAKALFCVGCHALSRNGKSMAVGLDLPAPAPLKVIDVATRTLLFSGASNFMTFSPDGELLITSNGSSMVMHDGTSGKVLTPNPLVSKGTMPDWSPDGTKVVYAEPYYTLPLFGSPGIEKGSLKLLTYDSKTGTFGAATSLVTSAGENNYYPTFSPDSKWIAFNRSSSNSYDATDATLYITRADGKTKALELKKANGGSNLCNSWPKFAPFEQTYGSSKLMWITFSSRRDYGLRLKGKSQAQIWMAAIRSGTSEFATDPSHPAFWLPFQDIKTGNHIAQWVAEVVRKPCGVDGECPKGEHCLKGLCEPL